MSPVNTLRMTTMSRVHLIYVMKRINWNETEGVCQGHFSLFCSPYVKIYASTS